MSTQTDKNPQLQTLHICLCALWGHHAPSVIFVVQRRAWTILGAPINDSPQLARPLAQKPWYQTLARLAHRGQSFQTVLATPVSNSKGRASADPTGSHTSICGTFSVQQTIFNSSRNKCQNHTGRPRLLEIGRCQFWADLARGLLGWG